MFDTLSSPRRLSLRSRRPSLLDVLMTWSHVARERRALRQLDSHALKDIGLTRKEAREESERPFWDAPDHWYR